ncbi:MAG: FAD-dependent oxidoreductase, partial [Syntrophomonadaceae bacterium]|nr:FAD-dependent oxidoreductase [Syntrophomonadaceae bacterium]
MQALEIKENVYWVGVQDPNLRVFDIVMTTEYGTTYNAYLVKGQEKTVLIETVKVRLFDEYLEDLQKVVNLSEIDYLIMNHTEPDHSGSVAKLLEKVPTITILGSQTALGFLKEITNQSFNSREIREGDSLDLGGKTLRFISAPFLHWPDTMYTYLPEDKILFTCDSFGSHYVDERVFNDLIEYDFMDAYKYYFDMIMGPFKPYVLEALEKIKDLELDVLCPGHGPVLRKNIPYYINLYREWATPPPQAADRKPEIVMAYVSAYGYTEMLADSIIEGIGAIGDFDIKRFNLVEDQLEDALQNIASADGLLIGSPTINGDVLPPIWELLIKLSPITHAGKVALAFGAYGWSGEAVPAIEQRLNALRMQVLPGMRVQFKPSARSLEDAFNLGMDFARTILDKGQDKTKTQWRCLVCGHIHTGEEPPDICPACGVGPENFVRVALEDEFSNDSNESFVIIGGGIAGLSAAQAIRKRNATGEIVVLTEEPFIPYYRPALSDFLSEDLPDKRLFVFDKAWYSENKIDIKTKFKVISMDTAAKTIIGANGESLKYDKLIIASGARSNVPPFKGVDNKGVFTLRSLEDAQAIKEAMKKAKKAVVIGGGVLGLEAVWEMLSSGLEVAVVEFNERLMPRQLDVSSSAILAEIITAKGVKLFLGKATEEILGEDGVVKAVRLNDGQVLDADLVLLSTGVKPNVEIAKEAGLEVKQGIVVDEKMRSNISGIYAAGDVAQFGDRMIGLWSTAMEMGKIAGAAAAGDWLEYKEPRISTMLAAF